MAENNNVNNAAPQQELNELLQIRRDKLKALQEETFAGLATAPPNRPECRSLFGPTTSTSIYVRPRKPQVIEGVSIEIIDVSDTRMISA